MAGLIRALAMVLTPEAQVMPANGTTTLWYAHHRLPILLSNSA
jgi:hypothetical protein